MKDVLAIAAFLLLTLGVNAVFGQTGLYYFLLLVLAGVLITRWKEMKTLGQALAEVQR